MNTKITEIAKKFKQEMEEFIKLEQIDIGHVEQYWSRRISELVLMLLTSYYYEAADAELFADKKGRRKAGLRVQHRNESRHVLTMLGELEYRRTYYKCRYRGIDKLAGVEDNQKVRGRVSLALVNTATSMSYAKSSQCVTGG